jgi:hypothetical protein
MGGCLCIGCLEKRIGRELRPADFDRSHEFNQPDVPGTWRLLERRGHAEYWKRKQQRLEAEREKA